MSASTFTHRSLRTRRTTWMIASCTMMWGTHRAPALLAQSTNRSAADTTFMLSRTNVLDVSMRTGELFVYGSDRADASLSTDGTGFQVRSGSGGVALTIGSNLPSRTRSRGKEGRVELTVPLGTRLIIRGASIDVHVRNVRGDVDVEVQSGEITLHSLGARAFVSSVSGDITILDGVGDVRASTVSGDIHAEQVRGDIDARSTSGDIKVTAVGARRVQLETSAGEIFMEGRVPSDATWSMATHAGDVTIHLLGAAAGILEASAVVGTIRVDDMTLLPSSDASRERGRVRRFEFGGGSNARISVAAFSGDIDVRRGARRRDDQ